MGAEKTVAGIVLAAGRSTRMGEPKALLARGDGTFLSEAVAVLRQGGCRPVVAVVGPALEEAARTAGATPVPGHPEGQQIDSLRAALDIVDTPAALVLPVDHPVRADTVTALVAAWRRSPEAVVRPVHQGRPGHPTLFPRRTWPALRSPDLDDGARSVVEGETVVDVSVEDPGAVRDVDTPESYRRFREEGL